MFATPEDIVNRAFQHLGVPRINLLSDGNRQSNEANFAYHKLRRFELCKSVWGFAVKRAVMRKIDVSGGTSRIITPAAYSAATTYGNADVVSYTNLYWQSQIAANLANTPGLVGIVPKWSIYTGPIVAQAHDTAVAYIPGDLVWATATAYVCIKANTNQAPPNATYWLPLTVTLAAPVFYQPFGYEKTGATQRQIYRLPANFLRPAPLDEKKSGVVRPNASAAMNFNDYEIEDPYLFSSSQGSSSGQADPLVLRFVADISDVPSMNPLFCEALAARIATELALSLTQSQKAKADAIALYDNALALAKFVNAIEAGSTENEPMMPTAQPSGREQGAG